REYDKIKIVVYSNSISDQVIESFKSLGSYDFLIKPTDLSELKSILKNLIVERILKMTNADN
ncbi:MAG TPA: hypothetical protein VFR70_04345, partial [Flavobacterium sp.]|nr:hypothetical protein [Flavobacterium sp.]